MSELKDELKRKKDELKDELKDQIEAAVTENSNIASAVNVNQPNSKTSVSTRQETVTKNGVTTKREIHKERRS
jgi:LPS O-antigen subunit length determinant protein (WzzB/FepE family)